MPNSLNVEGDNNLIFQDIKDSTITVHQNIIAKLPKELTLRIPKIHVSEVIGRESELEDLHKLLFDNKHVVVVNGLGGIGKTTLVQAYMSLYYDTYKHIVWINQSSENSIESDFVNTDGLKENLKIDTNGKDLPILFSEVLLGLKTLTDKPNLLVIDNAETSLTSYFDFLPNQPNWHLLVTSRENIERFYMKELGFLSPEKALELFQKHCTLIKDEEAIKEILHIIDYHTLTIEILAKTAQKLRTDISILKTAIEKDLKSPVFINHKGKKIDRVRSYLCSIFDLSKLNENEIWLMKQFACLPSEFQTYELLVELIEPEGKNEENFAETLTELVAKGWLLNNVENDSYKMHRVIGEITSQKLIIEIEDVINLIKTVTGNLNLERTNENPIYNLTWIPYGFALSNLLGQRIDNNIIILLNNLATILQIFGDFKNAKLLLKIVVTSSEILLGSDHFSTSLYYSNLGSVLQDSGEFLQAKEFLEKAISSDEKTFGNEHPTLAIRYSNLATVLQDLGNLKEAKKLLKKAIQIEEKSFDKCNPKLSTRYSNLALVLQDLGEYSDAKTLLIQALYISKQYYGEEHHATAKNYANLASLFSDLGDKEEARFLFEKALISMEKTFGENHPETINIYSNLGIVLKDLKDLLSSYFFLEKAKILSEKIYNEGHPAIARSYNNLATTLIELKEYESAKVLLNKAIISDEITYGKNHPSVGGRYSNLAVTLLHLKEFGYAITLLEKAYLIYQNFFGDNHLSTLTIKENLRFAKSQII